MADALQLTGEGSMTSLQSSAPALLHTLWTHHSMDAAPFLNQGRARYPGGMSELDAALHLLHPPDEDLEVGQVTILVDDAGETPSRPRPTNPVNDGTGPTPPYAVCRCVRGAHREPTWCPALPQATHPPRSWAHLHLSPPLFRTTGAHHRGQVLWQQRPGIPLLLLVVTTCGDPERVLGMQVRIRTNSLEFEFPLNSLEFMDPPEFEFEIKNLKFQCRIHFPVPTSRLRLLFGTKE